MDIIFLLTGLANLCSRPVKVEKPYTFALPILESEPETLEQIEKIAADLVEKTAEIPEEKPEIAFGKLQKPAEVIKPEEQPEKPEELPIEEKPQQLPEPETEETKEEEPPEIAPSQILEEQLKETFPKEEIETKKEFDLLKEIDELSTQEFMMPSEITKYLGSELQKIQQQKPPEKKHKASEEIDLDTLKIPLTEEETILPEETQKETSLASIELEMPQFSEALEEAAKFETLPPETEKETKPTRSFYELALDESLTFDNLKPASNRFAHAAVMSAMDSLGTMYNPLVITGPSGTGKTHFLSAMNFELASRIGQEKIFTTDVIRLTRAIEKLSKEGKITELDKKISSSEVLLIDDFHLLTVNQTNKPYLSKWLNGFIDNQKQVVLTSQVPLKDLSAIENKLDFWLSQGWAADLKRPDEENYKEIVGYILKSNALRLSKDEQDKFFLSGKMDLTQVSKICKRAKILDISIKEKKYSHSDILNMLTGSEDKLIQGHFTEEELSKNKDFPVFETVPWGSWGFFVPKGEISQINAFAFKIAEKMKELGISGGFSRSFEKEYFAEDLKSAGMDIFKTSAATSIVGALIINPPSVMHEETIHKQFCSDLEHMLDSNDICVCCMDMDKLKLPSSILQAIADIAGCRAGSYR